MLETLFKCKDATRTVSRNMDSNVPLYVRILCRLHLMMCGSCRLFSRQLHLIRRIVCRLAAQVESGDPVGPALSDSARRRIRNRIHRELETNDNLHSRPV